MDIGADIAAPGHQPVMLEQALAGLALKPAGRYIDATFGRGGHSRAILAQLGHEGSLVAFDRDAEAIAYAAPLQTADSRLQLRQRNFDAMGAELDPGIWDGVLFDFGVSSPQLDQAERGFSFLRDGPLDMRMDQGSGISAAQWLAQVPETELARVLYEYGEERHSRRVAAAIVRRRGEQAFETTVELAGFIASQLPRKHDGVHPATRCFQALRIAVNDELGAIERALAACEQLLAPGGRLVAISFHSLEDRLVKRYIQQRSRPPAGSRRLPPAAATASRYLDLGKCRPDDAEIARNPRARSAVMRIAERLP